MKRGLAPQCTLALVLFTLAAIAGCPAPADNNGGSDVAGANDSNDGSGGGDGGGGGTIDPNNSAPTAVLTASPNTGIRPATPVTLDASGSTDPDNDILSFAWSQTAGPAATLPASNAATISVEAPLVTETGEVKFAVTVTDGRGGQSTAEVALTVEVASEFAGYFQSAAPYRNSLTSEEAYHLLRRTQLGASPGDVAAAVQRGLSATVDELLGVKPVPDPVLALAETYEDEMPKRWMVHLLEGPNPFHERLAMFWHDRFATSRRVLNFNDRNLAVLHWEMLRRNAVGNYRQFLEELTLDPLMLIWLDGANSPKDKPNENYAREFWELFTLGRDTLYTEQDIREGARAFTGITLLRQSGKDARPIYDLLNHDETPKLIFPGRAQAANHNYETVIDLTLAQPEASRYVAFNLFRFFVHENPTPAVITDLADSFVRSNFEIAPLVKRILTSQAMFSPESRFNQVTTPVEHFVGVARTLDMHMHSEDSQGYILDRLVEDLSGSGMDLLNPPGVEGWHEDAAWLSDQWVINRVKALGWTMEYGTDRAADLPWHVLPPPATWNLRETRAQLVGAVAGVFHLPLTDAERDIYIEVLDQKGYLAFHLEQARYQPQHVWELIRLMSMDERVIGR